MFNLVASLVRFFLNTAYLLIRIIVFGWMTLISVLHHTYKRADVQENQSW